MADTSALDILNEPGVAVSKYSIDDDNLSDFTRSTTYHARIKLYTSASNVVKRKQFPENHYGLIVNKETTIDLGETFTGFPLAYRYKALDFSEKGKVKSYYDPKSDDFKRVKKEADKKRPPGEMSPCMAGIEFLLSVNAPEKPILGTLLCSSASLKGVAKKLYGMMVPERRFVLFASVLVDGKFVYQCPTVALYTGSFDVGDANKLKLEMKQFTDASGSYTEEAPPDDETPETPPGADGRER